jgi:glutathione peroxidase
MGVSAPGEVFAAGIRGSREARQALPVATEEGPFREKLKGYGIESADNAEVLWNFEKF